MNNTATIATVIMLVAVGILPLCLVSSQRTKNGLIDNCCDLGCGSLAFSKKTRPAGIYTISSVCRDDHLEADVYCDTINGGGGW